MTDIVAIDAVFYSNPDDQFKEDKIERELRKSFVGFCPLGSADSKHHSVVATGNWGCGAFRGNKQLKCMFGYLAEKGYIHFEMILKLFIGKFLSN